MPIEINELVIKVTVNDDKGSSATQGKDESAGKAEEIIRQAVEETLRIIENKKER